MCARSSVKSVRQADVPLSEISGRIQETGCVHSNLQSQLFTSECVSQSRRIQAFTGGLSDLGLQTKLISYRKRPKQMFGQNLCMDDIRK